MKDKLKSYGSLGYDIKEIIISEEQIQEKIKQLANSISNDYIGRNPLLIGVLKGVLFFMSDLVSALSIPAEIDFMAVSNYSAASRDEGFVRLIKDLEIPIIGRHVLFVEDVIDTGLTLNYLLQNLKARQPASLEVCVMFNKPTHRLINLSMKYKGFDLPDEFVVGYGLDYKERYRQLPFIGILKPEILRRSK